jgi:hypothetical protein
VAELQVPLRGLGIPSDVGVSFDGVSLGATAFSRNETVGSLAGVFLAVTVHFDCLAVRWPEQ